MIQRRNPNDPFFANISVLYSLSYAVKMLQERITPAGYVEYSVYPLEGVGLN
jgi:hypothetical protein